ncbi:MAG: hypothetical protein IJ410_06795 [Oscillospiraceae bacterium]|nr:hypothetical protein [Oscillospiraceae bacterium]
MKTDNRIFTVRRLFRNEIPRAKKCFSYYDFLHYNPTRGEGIMEIMIQGQMWGIFHGDDMVAATWLIPADSPYFRQTTAAWELGDLLEWNAADWLVAGYVWQSEEYSDCPVYQRFARLWVMQAAKLKKARVVHCSPRHINADMGRLFENGYRLTALRGLDKLVPHFIFVKEAEFLNTEREIPRNVKYCPLSDTKQLSMLCEHGWLGTTLDKDNNILFTKGS